MEEDEGRGDDEDNDGEDDEEEEEEDDDDGVGDTNHLVLLRDPAGVSSPSASSAAGSASSHLTGSRR